jgi:hypothetical protein
MADLVSICGDRPLQGTDLDGGRLLECLKHPLFRRSKVAEAFQVKETILRRTMELVETKQSIFIEIDQPSSAGGAEYCCELRIRLDGKSISTLKVHGADEIQAIMLAFDAIRTLMLDKYPTATWVGLPVELAFPRSIPYIAGIDTYKEIEAFANRVLDARYQG